MHTEPQIVSRVLVTPVEAEPLSLDEVKDHLHISGTGQDTYLLGLITSAREEFERILNISLAPQTWDGYWDQFPGYGGYPHRDTLLLPVAPLISVDEFEFTDTAETVHAWTVSGQNLLNESGAINAHVDTAKWPGRIRLAYARVWPVNVLKTTGAIRIRFTAGYAAGEIPAPIKTWLLLYISAQFENRDTPPKTEDFTRHLSSYRNWFHA